MDTQTIYQETIKFATLKHVEKAQIVPGTNLPYVVHLSNVAMEILVTAHYSPNFNLNFAIQLALLHDTIEDTATTYEELSERFGEDVANGVLALTKNSSLPKEERMLDSLSRMKKLPAEVWAVKLADRITNLQSPPVHWDNAKKVAYYNEATVILENLKEGNVYLGNRLSDKIEEYKRYLD